MKALVRDLVESFHTLFPNVNLINKFHHLFHYAESISWSGPMWGFICLRYEARHAEIKLRAQNMHNFKNPAKTLMRICQCSQSSKWGAGDVKLFKVSTTSGKKIWVNRTRSFSALTELGFTAEDKIFQTKKVKIQGVEFRVGLFVCLSSGTEYEDNLPRFGKIIEIILLDESNVHFLVIPSITMDFDPDFNAFVIEVRPNESFNYTSEFISSKSLAHYKPVCPWTERVSKRLYISMRHILL